MTTEYFNIGNDDWAYILISDYSVKDYDKMWSIMRTLGLSDAKAQAALSILSQPDKGMTLTSFTDRMSILFIGRSSTPAQWFDTLIHEIKHLVEHISEYYEVNPKGEPAAYLQGEIGRQLFPIIIQRFCRK